MGRVLVSKTRCCGFKSCLPCHFFKSQKCDFFILNSILLLKIKETGLIMKDF